MTSRLNSGERDHRDRLPSSPSLSGATRPRERGNGRVVRNVVGPNPVGFFHPVEEQPGFVGGTSLPRVSGGGRGKKRRKAENEKKKRNKIKIET